MSQRKWIARLGDSEWAQFTHAGAMKDGLQLLGSLRRGMQTGALARDLEGRYVLLNGDHQTTVNQSQVEAAVRRATPRPGQAGAPAVTYQPVIGRPQGTPVVVVRRRRVLEVA